MDERIEVIIRKDGSVVMEGQGFRGADCERAMSALEQSLGRVTSSEPTSEYFAEAAAKADA